MGLPGSELERRVARCLFDEFLEGRIAVHVKEPRDERPPGAPAQVRREARLENATRLFGGELHGDDLFAAPTLRDNGFARRAQVSDPVHLAEWRLDVPSALLLQDRHGKGPFDAAGAATNGEQDVRAERQA